MTAAASELIGHQHAASVAVINSDARAMAAETAAAQAIDSAQIDAAMAADEVLHTRDQAKHALEYADKAYSDLQSRANLEYQDSSLNIAYLSELAEASQNRFKSEEVIART